MTLNDPYPRFKVTLFFDAEYLRNGTRCRHSFNGIVMRTCIRPTQQCHFEWPWVNLSDWAKYSMTRSIARPFCDSTATCQILLYGVYPVFRFLLAFSLNLLCQCTAVLAQSIVIHSQNVHEPSQSSLLYDEIYLLHAPCPSRYWLCLSTKYPSFFFRTCGVRLDYINY